MIEETIFNFVSTLGFPIFIAIWLLMRTDAKEEATRVSIDKNTSILEQLVKVIEQCKKR